MEREKVLCVKSRLQGEIQPNGSYVAYASVFGNVDSDGDIVESGAFRKTIKDRKGVFPIVWFHNPAAPIGIAQVEEDERGLRVKGQLNLETVKGKETYSLMKQGVVGDHSFAFDVVKSDYIETEDGSVTGRRLKELKLYEVSPLTNGFAANPEAGLLMIKRRNNIMAIANDDDSDETSEPDNAHSDLHSGSKPGESHLLDMLDLKYTIERMSSDLKQMRGE